MTYGRVIMTKSYRPLDADWHSVRIIHIAGLFYSTFNAQSIPISIQALYVVNAQNFLILLVFQN